MKTFIKATNLIFAFLFIIMTFELYSQTTPDERCITFENEQTAVLVGHDGLIMRTEDAGLTWTTQESGTENTLYGTNSIMHYNQEGQIRIQIVVGENGTILKSVDNGTTWDIKQSNTNENLMNVYAVNPNYIITCGGNGTILVSTDYGESWSALTSPVNSMLNDVMFVEHSVGSVTDLKGFTVGEGGVILVTLDYGLTWTQLTSGVTENLKSVYAYADNYIVAVGDNGIMVATHDGGQSWSEVTTGISLNINDIKFLGNDVVMTACDNGMILRSDDKGETWTAVQTSSQSDLFAVNFCNSTFGITVGEAGTELYTLDGGLTWENREQEILVSRTSTKNTDNIKLNQNYPNPFNPTTVINYEIPANANVSIKIYDLVGKEVRTLVNGYQTAGTHSAVFNAANLSSGIYFYVLRVNTGVNEVNKTMRMILTK